MPVQGRTHDWESLSVRLDGGSTLVDIKSIDWSDTYGTTPVYGAGGAAIAWGNRNYRAQGSMELGPFEYASFYRSMALKGGIYRATFDILLEYGDNPYAAGYAEKHRISMPIVKVVRRGGASRQGAAEAGIRRLELEILGGVNEFGGILLGKI